MRARDLSPKRRSGRKCGTLEKETRLIDELGLDSLTITEFLAVLEREFQLSVPDGDLTKENFSTVGSVERYLCERLDG